MDIILASTSRYRRDLLERLRIQFRCIAPPVKEVYQPGEPPSAMAQRLALAKSRSVASLHPGALVIGSDQVAAIDGTVFGKPGSFDNAVAQLLHCSGREVRFHTAVALICLERGLELYDETLCTVHFRDLTLPQISQYLRLEEPFDCAGSFKIEGFGIALFERIQSSDPTGLEGLPLTKVVHLLAKAGIDVLTLNAE